MAAGVIVSYDGTANDDDALALGRMLAAGQTPLALAYVRHSREYDPRREDLAEHDAQRRLEQGAGWLEEPDVRRHVVIDASTGAGLAKLAAAEQASVVVFGSDYRTSPGRVEPGAAAQQMLQGGTVAVAVAVAGLRTGGHSAIASISTSASTSGGGDDDAPQRTVEALAGALGAAIAAPGDRSADLVVVGSQPSAPHGQIALSGATRSQLDSAASSVLVLPRGIAVQF